MKPAVETFPFPPFKISLHQSFIPGKIVREEISTTNVIIVLESSDLSLSTLSITFIESAIHLAASEGRAFARLPSTPRQEIEAKVSVLLSCAIHKNDECV